MKRTFSLLLLASLLGFTIPGFAHDPPPVVSAIPLPDALAPAPPPKSFYRPEELSLSIGILGLVEKRHLDRSDGLLDFGLAYYATEYIGFRLNAAINFEEVVLDRGLAALTFRYPIGQFAPYGYGGLGYDWQVKNEYWEAGAGLEFRVTRSLGLYAEAGHEWFEGPRPNELVCRVGVRFAF